MKLLKLHVENFGTLQDFDLTFTDRLNILYRKNGWGKSTLAVFIKAMLYGLPATSKHSLDDNERKKYAPWQGGAYGGSLDFETALGRFRAERFFGAKESGDSFSLYDLSSNKPSTVYSQRLGEELFGIDASGFERSTYLSQRSQDEKKDNVSISARLANLLDAVDDIGSFDGAMEALEKRRRYYVMTGNRGAIAELEQERVEKQAELERCLRVEEAMLAQNEELTQCAEELRTTRALAEQVRSQLQKAALAREKSAFLERKNRMQDEINQLREKKRDCDRFLGDQPPTAAECRDARALYDRIRESSVRLETLSAPNADTQAWRTLKERYPSGLPSAVSLERAEQENAELQQLRTRCEALEKAQAADPILQRFRDGVPSEEELKNAVTNLHQAQRLSVEAADLKGNIPSASATKLLYFGIPLIILGLLLFALVALSELLSPLAPYLVLLLAGGAVGVAVGGILCLRSYRIRQKLRREAETLGRKRQATEKLAEQLYRQVKALLAKYRMPNVEDELSHSLTELTLLAGQYREARKKRLSAEAEKREYCARRTEIAERLQSFLSRYSENVTQKEDYRTELATLSQALERSQYLQAAKERRNAEIDTARSTLEEQKAELLPFLRRFDPTGKWRAGECLEHVTQTFAERERLVGLISEKEAELHAYIKEKKLNEVTDSTDAEEFDRLSAEDNRLLARLNELQKRHATLKNAIEHLSLDADRIPELRSEQSRLKEQLDEARANATTIANTAKLLEEAKTALDTRYLDGMQSSFRRFLTLLTGDDAPDSMMDTSFEVRLTESGKLRTMESFSCGWRDTVRFCVRLSLADALCADGEKPFLLLDDPFVNFDDERANAARELLDVLSSEYQILYLVCHKDRL